MASSNLAAPRTFAASSTNNSKKCSSRGIRRRRMRFSTSPLRPHGSAWPAPRANQGYRLQPRGCRPAACAMLTIMDRLHVATLNILNLADRWSARQGLIYADMAALQPDLLALQEVVYVIQQDRLIGAAGEGRYAAVRGWAGRPEYGNSLLVREPLRAEAEARLDLGLQRAAHRARVALPRGTAVVVAVTHFHHPPGARAERDGQAQALLTWLDDAAADGPAADATILAGDFNARPDEPAYARITAAGFRSVHLEANGREPEVTWPSGLIAPAMDRDGEPDCLDYIWIRGAIRTIDCRLVFDRPDADDPTLYPSDHFGLAAQLEIR